MTETEIEKLGIPNVIRVTPEDNGLDINRTNLGSGISKVTSGSATNNKEMIQSAKGLSTVTKVENTPITKKLSLRQEIQNRTGYAAPSLQQETGSSFSSKSISSCEPVYVEGYYRKDGTYVRPHYRSAPGCD